MNAVFTPVRTLADDFPGLTNPDGTRWHYLDTGATAQKPQAVIDATVRALGADYATVHRGVYSRSAEMTLGYEAARRRVAGFIGGVFSGGGAVLPVVCRFSTKRSKSAAPTLPSSTPFPWVGLWPCFALSIMPKRTGSSIIFCAAALTSGGLFGSSTIF